MASLEQHGKTFRIVYRFGRLKRRLTLKTASERAARGELCRFEESLRLIELGTIDPPPPNADVGLYILSGGRQIKTEDTVESPSLGSLFRSYQEQYPDGAKEPSTRTTEAIHIGHLTRLLGNDLPLSVLTTEVLQRYITRRGVEEGQHGQKVSHETVRKEIGTLATLWNRWAVPQGMVSSPAPTKGLVYPKSRTKPPFQTRPQIERKIARGGLTSTEERELWEALYLEKDEVGEFLTFILAQAGRSEFPCVYPLFTFAGHTGARRSEMIRCRVDDVDLTESVVTLREKKRNRSRETTFRRVPLTPFLKAVLSEWLSSHPGGQFTFCRADGRPLREGSVGKLFRWIVKDSKWEVLRGWHVLRHSFCSNCAAKGIDQRLIDEWMGHETEEMRRRYRHLFPDLQREAIETVFGRDEG